MAGAAGSMQLVTLLGAAGDFWLRMGYPMSVMKGEIYEEIGGVAGVAVRLLGADGGACCGSNTG
jgi:hypothetical protein